MANRRKKTKLDLVPRRERPVRLSLTRYQVVALLECLKGVRILARSALVEILVSKLERALK
ncbi:MAG TPA: hypothetical protein VFT74_16130 [Isosphaeraceae bacterium]|nr:hypothetical protein [Isosphaeraceae bacterium]